VGVTYTSGTWRVRPGDEDEFVAAWEAFVTWAAQMPGSGTFHLVRDIDDPSHFMSFGDWDSFSAQDAWKLEAEFRERIGRVRAHCDEFTPSVFELVASVS
jgi:heme-degrading monooxygenase HmoA